MRILRVLLATAVAALPSVTTTAQGASCTATTDVVCTEQGAVRGIIEGSTLAFKGIPYAQPPIGPLRWKPPQPVRPWEGA